MKEDDVEVRADCQSAAGMAGEYDGAGDVRVAEDRARRTSEGALGSLDSCERT